MQCAVAASHSAMFGARFPARVQPARARTAPRAVSTRAAAWDEEEAAPQRRRGPGFTKEDDPAMTAEKDLFSLARASYGGPRDNQGEADVFSASPIKDEMAWLKQPVYEITGKRGSLEEAVQRVQYGQPYDLEGNPDEELMLLEDYLKKGTSNIYVLVRGLSARTRLEEEKQLHNPTPLGENTKAYERAVCELALEMHEYGDALPDHMVEYPAAYFSRRPKPPPKDEQPDDEVDLGDFDTHFFAGTRNPKAYLRKIPENWNSREPDWRE